MKRFIRFIVSITIVFSLSACGNNSAMSTGTKPTPSTEGHALTSTTSKDEQPAEEAQLFDYSRFGFSNMYGLTEWFRIDAGSVESAYFFNYGDSPVLCDTGNLVINLENGYIEARYFDPPEITFTGDRSLGDLDGVYQYQVVNNSLIAMKAGREPNIEITVNIREGIPFITLTMNGDGYGLSFLEGIYVPTAFLDLDLTDFLNEYAPTPMYYFRNDHNYASN